MAWFKPRFPLTTSQKVDIERHLSWLIHHFGREPISTADYLTPDSTELIQATRVADGDISKLAEFVGERFPFETHSCVIEEVPNDADLTKVPYDFADENTIFIREAQAANVIEAVSGLATAYAKRYLSTLPKEQVIATSRWLPEFVSTYFGFGVLQSNSAGHYSKENTASAKQDSKNRYVATRILGTALGYLGWLRGQSNYVWPQYLGADAAGTYKQTAKFLKKTSDSIVQPGKEDSVFRSTDVKSLAAMLSSKSDATRLASLQRIVKLGVNSGEGPGLTPDELMTLLGDPCDEVRQVACGALGQCDGVEPSHLEMVAEMLHDSVAESRYVALRTLAVKAPKEKKDVYNVLRLLKDPASLVFEGAVVACAQLQLDDDSVPDHLLSALKKMLNQRNVTTAALVCSAIEHVTGDAAEFVEKHVDSDQLFDAREALKLLAEKQEQESS